MATQPRADPFVRSRPPSEATLKVQSLLSRYPDLSEDELAALIKFYAHVPLLDVGRLSADEQLSDQFEAFLRDHGPASKLSVASLVIFFSYPAILFAAVLWWMLS